MNTINFIRPLPPEKDREVRSWLRITALLYMLIIICTLIIIAMQWYLHRQLKGQHATLKEQLHQYNSIMDVHRTTKSEQELLQKKIAKLHRYHHNPQSPLPIIETIAMASKQTIIESLTIKNGAIELKVIAPTSAHAMQLVQTLQASPLLKTVYLQSLKINDNNQAITLIKAAVSS